MIDSGVCHHVTQRVYENGLLFDTGPRSKNARLNGVTNKVKRLRSRRRTMKLLCPFFTVNLQCHEEQDPVLLPLRLEGVSLA